MKLRTPISGEPHKARAEFPLGNFTLPHGEYPSRHNLPSRGWALSGLAMAALAGCSKSQKRLHPSG
jgi:hypothetical protein